MHLYVAGPMSGIESFNYPAFDAASAELRDAGFEVTNPAEIALPCGCRSGDDVCGPDPHEWDEWIRAALRAMLERAQGVALLDGWEGSRGARIEIALAQSLGWQVGVVADWLEAAREQVAGQKSGMVTLDEFRAEIRAEVSRREVELETQLRIAFRHGRARSYDARLTAVGAARVRSIEAELERLTGIPAWLSKGQRRALELASVDEGGVVRAARVRSPDRGLSYRPVSEGAPSMSLFSLGERGLLSLSYDGRGRIESGRLTEEGARVASFLRARAERLRERRELQRRGRSGV